MQWGIQDLHNGGGTEMGSRGKDPVQDLGDEVPPESEAFLQTDTQILMF